MKKLTKAVELAAVVILLILASVVFLQVILRNMLNTGFVWGEEMSRFLLLSMVLIAAPVVFYLDKHVKFDLLERSLPFGGARIHRIVSTLLIMFFYIVYIVSHLKLMKNSGNVVSPSLSIPNSIYFGSALIGAVLAIFLGGVRIIEIIRTKE